MKRLFIFLFLFVVGCEHSFEGNTIKSLQDIQGTWKVIEATDPMGKAFEADNIEMVIEGNKATSQDVPLRLELNGDSTYVKLFGNNNGIDQEISEVIVETSNDKMLWMDRKNNRQTTLFQRK